jgi:hypothetical protein
VTVHVVVTCTQRKRRPIPAALHLRRIPAVEPVGRCWMWRERLIARGGPEAVSAVDLYGGEHWQVARSLPVHGAEGGQKVVLWVSSAGYGLIPADAPLRAYAATFSSAQADSVLRPGAPVSDLSVWWRELSAWEGPAPGTPRTITSLARSDPSASVLVAVSPPYLRACGRDIADAAAEAGERVAVVCAGGTPAGPLAEVALPGDARLQAALGGTRGSLNVRIAGHLLATHSGPFTRPALAATLADLLERQPPLPRYERQELDDAAVVHFITAELDGLNGSAPGATRLLRRLRDSGYACEQRRFASLYRLVKESH